MQLVLMPDLASVLRLKLEGEMMVLPDALLVGPSLPSPIENLRLRSGFWAKAGIHPMMSGIDLFGVEECWRARSAPRVRVLWSSSWQRSVQLAFALVCLGPDAVVEICAVSPYGEEGTGRSAERGLHRAALGVWEAFTSRTPVEFDDVCRRPPSELASVSRLRRTWRSFFPRWWGGALRLSRLDELLVRALTLEPQPWAHVLARSASTAGLLSIVEVTGDMLIRDRLQAWATWRSGEVVTMSDTSGPPRFAAGSAAAEILEHGLTTGPALEVGGTAAYATDELWAIRRDGRFMLVGRP